MNDDEEPMNLHISPELLITVLVALASLLSTTAIVTWRLSSVATIVAREAADADKVDARLTAQELHTVEQDKDIEQLQKQTDKLELVLVGDATGNPDTGGISGKVQRLWTRVFSHQRMTAVRDDGG